MQTRTRRTQTQVRGKEKLLLESHVLQLRLARWRLVGSSGARDHVTNKCVLVTTPFSPVLELAVNVDSTRVGDALWKISQEYIMYYVCFCFLRPYFSA